MYDTWCTCWCSLEEASALAFSCEVKSLMTPSGKRKTKNGSSDILTFDPRERLWQISDSFADPRSLDLSLTFLSSAGSMLQLNSTLLGDDNMLVASHQLGNYSLLHSLSSLKFEVKQAVSNHLLVATASGIYLISASVWYVFSPTSAKFHSDNAHRELRSDFPEGWQNFSYYCTCSSRFIENVVKHSSLPLVVQRRHLSVLTVWLLLQ